MIEVDAVQPTAREFRSITRGWGAIHWVCIIPTYAFLFGFSVFGVLATSLADGLLPPALFSGLLLGSWLVWLLGRRWTTKVATAEHRNSPTGPLPWRWEIDASALAFDNGLQRNRVDWRAVRSVREDKDRFVFLVTPGYNPVLPTRLLSEGQLAELRELIAEANNSGRLGAGLGVD